MLDLLAAILSGGGQTRSDPCDSRKETMISQVFIAIDFPLSIHRLAKRARPKSRIK